ncbi:MAG: Zn-dependent hydrolase [Terriglobales bacterium]
MLSTRRRFMGQAVMLSAAALSPGLLSASPESTKAGGIRTNGPRLRENLEGLSVFGRPEGGRFADGVSRLAYSDSDVSGRAYAMDLMRAAGLEPRIDPAGNILARRKGTEDALPPILFGSHIDSVPSGGNFDGDLGSLSAIEVVRTLNEQKVATRHPLEVVIWANEEGVAYGNGLDGSRAAAGELRPGELDLMWNGVKKSDALRKIGGDPERIAQARRAPGSFHCYVELHIEQGGTLANLGVPVGVVEGIVAIDRYDAVIRGFANHAGTTPMPERRDALIAAAELTLAVREIVTREPGRQVGTVGELHVAPNAPNVIPGTVRHSIELRDLSSDKIALLARAIEARAKEIAARTGTEIEIRLTSHHESALATPAVQEAIERAASGRGLRHTRLPSGAGHDAQMMARLGPMGMIFVPSVGGISHSPREFTLWQDCAWGADVLLRTVLLVDDLKLACA